MVRITPTGPEPDSLETWLERVREKYRAAFGDDLNLADETPQGQLIAIEAMERVQLDEAIVSVANGISRDRAIGYQLDQLFSLLDIDREEPTFSTADVTIAGRSGIDVPAGSIVRSTDGDLWRTRATVTISARGMATVAVQAEEPGLITAATGEINTIVSTLGGWDSVTNPAPAVAGKPREDDVAYNTRYGRLTASNAVGPAESVRGALIKLPAVRKAEVYENTTTASVTARGLTIPVRSMFTVVDADDDAAARQAIASTILLKRTIGLPTTGGTGDEARAVNVIRRQQTHTVNYRVATKVPVSLTVGIRVEPESFPGEGYTQIHRAILDVVAALEIAEPLSLSKLYVPILAIGGVDITAPPTISPKEGGRDVTKTTGLDLDQLITLENADITVTAST